jgi:flagellar basal body-associated protein FliL
LACIYGGLIVIIWAGWSMITSQGDSGKVKKATQMITWVIVGIVVVLLARAIIGFTYYIVTGKRGGVPNLNGTSNNTPSNNQPYVAPEVNTVPNINNRLFEESFGQ